jgi:methionine sulfoxide reductase heme-binding subunit
VPKRAVVLNWIKVLLSVWCLMPALDLARVLEGMDRHFIRNYNYQVFALAIAVSGAWAFIFLFISLSCTPMHRLTGFRVFGELRRTLGLFAFFYAFLHLLVYFVIGQKLNLKDCWTDATYQHSRIPGWAALILLIPLAITSTDGMVRRVGAKRWKLLHRLVYLAVALAVGHVAWTDFENQTDYHRTKNALVPFLILMVLRLLPLSSWRQKLKGATSGRSVPGR